MFKLQVTEKLRISWVVRWCYRVLSFLVLGSCLAWGSAAMANVITAMPERVGPPEKDELTLGFIKLTDMAPLAVAYEMGFFEDEDLYVSLEAQANWKVLLDRVIDGELDGAHMLAGQPLAATIGIGTKANLITAFSMSLNGNAITVSNDVWAEMKPHLPVEKDGRLKRPIWANALKPIIERQSAKGRSFNMGMVFPVSSHNYELRYWLAAGGIHPGFYAPTEGDNSGQRGAEVLLSVTPPPQMPATLESGTIQGYCVGEPWNQQAVLKGLGVPVITNYEIWRNNPEKVFGVSEAWATRYPNTHLRLIKALIRAAHWLDVNQNKNRLQAIRWLAQRKYVGADRSVLSNSMSGTFEYEKGDAHPLPDFNVFFRHHASYPYYSDAIWFLTQMRRWGQIPQSKPDGWYTNIAKRVYRPDIYRQAALSLIAEGKLSPTDFPDFEKETGFHPPQSEFIDGVIFDGRFPNRYLSQFAIGLK